MKLTLDPSNPQAWPSGQINAEQLDATREAELAAQQASDDAGAMDDAAEYARGVSQRRGLTQQGL